MGNLQQTETRVEALLENVRSNLDLAIEARALFSHGQKSAELFQLSAPVQTQLWTVIYGVFVHYFFALMRIHDEDDRTTSIPVILRFLVTDSEKQALAKRVYKKVLNIRTCAVRTGSYSSIRKDENGELMDFEMEDRQKRYLMARGLWEAREEAQIARNETPIKITEIANDYASLKGGHLMQRANGLRNEVLAHSAADKKLQVMEDFSDADKLLERTVDIVDRLNLTIERAGYNYETTQKNAALRAEYFWQFIIGGLRQTNQS